MNILTWFCLNTTIHVLNDRPVAFINSKLSINFIILPKLEFHWSICVNYSPIIHEMISTLILL